MSKPTLLTLPCVLLLLDYWPFERWQKPFTPVNISAIEGKTEEKIDAPAKSRSQVIAHLLWEKAPFFLLSMLLGIMLIGQLQANDSFLSLQRLSFSDRIMNAIVSYVSYLGKTLWPVDLACFYPYLISSTVASYRRRFCSIGNKCCCRFLSEENPFPCRWLVLVFRRSVSCQWIDAGGGPGNG